MPRRKGSKNYKTVSKTSKRQCKPNTRKKEKQIIKTRLIEISMKMEDHIYHKAPVSEVEAEMFIREVSSYRTECTEDERSLQVIEKLIRCMKAIIAEHQEQKLMCRKSNDEPCDMEDDRTNASSPVYSLPDEDRTQLSQTLADHIAINNTDGCHKQFDRTQVAHTVKHNVSDNNSKLAKAIDLCDDDDEVNAIEVTNITSNIHSDVNIHKALSNLSIRDINPLDRMDTDVECSQSILNNYEVINNVQQNKTHDVDFAGSITIDNGRIIKDVETRKLNQLVKTTAVGLINTTRVVKPLVLNINDEHTKADTGNVNVNHPLVAKVSKALKNTFNKGKPSATDKEKMHTMGTGCALQEVPAIVTRNNNINNTKIIDKTCDSYKTNNDVSNVKILKNKYIDKNNEVNTPVIVKNKRAPRKKKLAAPKIKNKGKLRIENSIDETRNDNTLETVSKRKSTKKKVNDQNSFNKKDIPVPIYNKNVVNDLSWLENIRYVREIAEDEYDRKLADLNENFWDNYMLPPNFDDSDFL